MFDFIRTYQLDIMLALSAACFSFAILLFVTQFLDKRKKAIMILMEFTATFLLYFDRMAYIYSGDVSQKGYILVRVSNFFVFFLTSMIVLGFNLYVSDLLLEEGGVQELPLRMKVVMIGAIIGMALVVINLFTGQIYYFDELNKYHRGPMFLICYLIPVICPLIQFTVIWEYRKSFNKLIFISLVLYIFVPIGVGILQIFTYGISIVNMAMVLVSISLYFFTYLDINKAVVRAHELEVEDLMEEKDDVSRMLSETADAFMSIIENNTEIHYVHVREELIKGGWDPKIISVLDLEQGKKEIAETSKLEKKLDCTDYRSAVSTGISIGTETKKITFSAKRSPSSDSDFSFPSIVIFDSLDKRVHNNVKTIEAYQYLEYGEVWFDGHYVSTGARKMEAKESERTLPFGSDKTKYEIVASRFEDHLRIRMFSAEKEVELIIALPDKTKSSYIGLTGENCKIRDIEVEKTGETVTEEDIPKIAEEISYIDRLESDLPNVQIDRTRSASTESVPLLDGMRIEFHAMALPSANLVWHCPYILLFYSKDGEINGEGYREYALIKLNGEVSSTESTIQNKFHMKKMEDFPGWEDWKAKNKEGLECAVEFIKKGNKVTTITTNLGVSIENTTIIDTNERSVYLAITGDQVALTDIRIY